jgi:LPS export ABC transporter protein LptC
MLKKTSQLFLEKSVVLTQNKTNDKSVMNITTEHLQLYLNKKIAKTTASVLFKTSNISAQSDGMKMNIETSKIFLLKNVRSHFIKEKK